MIDWSSRAMRGAGTAAAMIGIGVVGVCHAQSPDQARSGDAQGHENIVVTGIRTAADYREANSSVAGFSAVKVTEIPQAVQTLNRDFIDDSGALSFVELFQHVPGASNGLSRSVPFGSGQIVVRGQDVSIYRDGLRDIDFSDIDQSAFNNVARIDILKGPAGLIFGTGGPGGIVNIVTKRPVDRLAAETRLTLGTRDTHILSGDVSVPLGGGFGLRATGEVERSDSFIRFSKIARENFSGTLAYDAGGRLTGSIVYENFANHDDGAMTRVALPTAGTIMNRDRLVIDRRTYLGEPASDYTDSYGSMLSAYLNYKFSDDVSASIAGRRTTVHFDQSEVRTLGAVNLTTFMVARSRARELLLAEEQYNARGFVTGKFATGLVSHDLTVGYEYYSFDLRVDNRTVAAAMVTPINVLAPVYRVQPLVAGAPVVTTEVDRSNEIFAQDVARLGPVAITGAVRQVWTDYTLNPGSTSSLDQTLFQLGGTWEVVKQVALFAGYNSGFNANSGIASTSSRTGARFDPETYRQFEVGVKTDALAGVTSTISAFDLVRKGILVTDPLDAAFMVQVGEERSRGIEAELLWNPTAALSVTLGYLYLDSVVTKDSDPTRIGRRRPGASEHRANGFASYTFQNGLLRNLRVSAAVTYVGKAFASLTNVAVRPAYVVTDFGASYTIDRLRIDAFLSNAFDEEYYITRNETMVNPGEPRQFRMRASISF